MNDQEYQSFLENHNQWYHEEGCLVLHNGFPSSHAYWEYYGSKNDVHSFDPEGLKKLLALGEKLKIPAYADYGIAGCDMGVDDIDRLSFDWKTYYNDNHKIYFSRLPYRIFFMTNEKTQKWRTFFRMVSVDSTGKVLSERGINCPEKLDMDHFLKVRVNWEDEMRPFVVSVLLELIEANRAKFHCEQAYRLAAKDLPYKEPCFLPEFIAYKEACNKVEKIESQKGGNYSALTIPETIQLYSSVNPDLWPFLTGGYAEYSQLDAVKYRMPLDTLLPWYCGYYSDIIWESKFSNRQISISNKRLTLEKTK